MLVIQPSPCCWLEKEREGKRNTLRRTAGKIAIAATALVGIGWLLTQRMNKIPSKESQP